jgi:hypothetical protein
MYTFQMLHRKERFSKPDEHTTPTADEGTWKSLKFFSSLFWNLVDSTDDHDDVQ